MFFYISNTKISKNKLHWSWRVVGPYRKYRQELFKGGSVPIDYRDVHFSAAPQSSVLFGNVKKVLGPANSTQNRTQSQYKWWAPPDSGTVSFSLYYRSLLITVNWLTGPRTLWPIAPGDCLFCLKMAWFHARQCLQA
jgi:hypothetical protein